VNPDTTEHHCPRRAETVHQSPGPDHWTDRASLAGGIGPTCSYCGSLSPDVFMAKVRDGWIVEPTDKSYKAYLDRPYTAEELERIKTNSAVWKAVRDTSLADGKTEQEAVEAADRHWEQHEAPEAKGSTVAKFYYQHLDAGQRSEFIALHNDGAMKLAYPGWFYVRPFFCRPNPGAGVAA
jgi:hypothetical protein